MADVRGACKRVFDGTTDVCQEFEADEFDTKLCDNCGCKKGFHEKLHAPSAALAAPAPACGPRRLRRLLLRRLLLRRLRHRRSQSRSMLLSKRRAWGTLRSRLPRRGR
jgi:hypothetical protein